MKSNGDPHPSIFIPDSKKVTSMLRLWFVANTILWAFVIMLGTFHLGLNVIVLMLAGAVWLIIRRRAAVSSVVIVSLFGIYLVFSFIVAVTGVCKDQYAKMMTTGPILMSLVLIGLEVGRRAENRDWIKLQRTAVWALLVAFSAFLVELAVPSRFPLQAMYRAKGELSGLFTEPSAVAFSLFPCVAVLLVAESRKIRRSGMMALVGLIVFSKSSTLLALVVAWVLYRLFIQRRLLQAGLLALGCTALIALGSAINYDLLVAPTIERIVGISAPDQTINISSLVYVQGWQDGWGNLVRTHGLGLGFNMMGCHPLPDVPARRALTLLWIELSEANAQDGSMIFGKVVSEAGVLGVAFYIVVIWRWVWLERKIQRAKDGEERFAASIQAALMFCFVATSFIRSTGYFSGGMLLWIAATGGASKLRKRSPLKVEDVPELPFMN